MIRSWLNKAINNITKINNQFIKKSDIANGYQNAPSFINLLPWKDYNDKYRIFLLEDNKSLAVCFKITAIPCEARPHEMMVEISKAISEAIKNSIPLEKNNPWILQCFIERSSDLSSHFETIKNCIPLERQQSLLTQTHLKTLKEHLDYVSKSGGIFFDKQVTNQIFRGGFVIVRVVLYRRIQDTAIKNQRRSNLEDTLRVARKFADQVRACGLKVKRLRGEEFHQWMVKWFNPKPRQTQGDVNELVKTITFPTQQEKPFGWDLAENCFFNTPESYDEGWLFDGLPHKIITVQSLTTVPAIGHLTAERKRNTDDKIFNLIDHLPENSIFSLQIVLQAPSEVELHLKLIEDSAVGRHARALKVKEEVDTAFSAITNGNYLFPVVMAVYLRGENLEDLHEKEAYTEVLLNSNGFKVISDHELFPIDAYMRYLPMCYNYSFDKHNSYRSKYIPLDEIAKLLPFYGRSRGSDNPGFIAFNRGGEPWFYDYFKDITKNSHFLLLGETGTGKSNLLNFLAMHTLALYNPRLFIIEAGGSFNLLAQYCASLGLKVNRVKIDPKNPISLNPFANALKVLDQIELFDQHNRTHYLELEAEKLTQEQQANSDFDIDEVNEESRDILGDMVLAALVMITGGEKREEERITRSDRMLIMDMIIDAASYVKEQGSMQMIASDLVAAFERHIIILDPQREGDKIRRAREMADGLRYFTKDPVSSRFFNTPGEPWGLADITLVDFGLFAQEGYEAQRSIAFVGCVNKMLALAEANQYSDRAIVSIFDENHLFSRLPLLAMIQTRIAKMGRKLGLWQWVATQNLKDFPDEARKMLSLLETWICLALPPDEIDQIERFKPLTPERRALLLSAKKESGKYTEGVLLGSKIQELFRNVPPRLYLTFAATEQREKNHRRRLMQQLDITELQAAMHIAQAMMQVPMEESSDD